MVRLWLNFSIYILAGSKRSAHYTDRINFNLESSSNSQESPTFVLDEASEGPTTEHSFEHSQNDSKPEDTH